jgi:pimeloyl-ACP methyl ester carboxylesterase
LSRYRNVDRDWEDLAAYHHRPVEIPALFLGGSRDGPTIWGKPAIESFPKSLPKLHRSVVLEDCGHWIQQERPKETNEALLDFLRAVH